VKGIVGGGWLYKESAFETKNEGSTLGTAEERKKLVEVRILELAYAGGGHENID
jgi:hypothetical protein